MLFKNGNPSKHLGVRFSTDCSLQRTFSEFSLPRPPRHSCNCGSHRNAHAEFENTFSSHEIMANYPATQNKTVR